ncbi:MAG: DUF411 domain-containing protein [Rhodothermales bacterium]
MDSLKKSHLLIAFVVGAVIAVGFITMRDSSGQDLPSVTVYKSPTCGCCSKWVDHLEASGFTVNAIDTDEGALIKARYGVPGDLRSCHTALVDGYVIEGHVPAEEIKRMLAEDAEMAGLAVPGMPMGSPGMEGPRSEAYDILAFQKDGSRAVYASR